MGRPVGRHRCPRTSIKSDGLSGAASIETRTSSWPRVGSETVLSSMTSAGSPPVGSISISVLENEVLFNADFVCLFGSRQPMRNRRLTLKEYLQLPHAIILTGEGHQAMVDRPLAQLGVKRRIAHRIPFFIPAVFAIAHIDLVLTVPRTLARTAAAKARLRVIEPPRELKPFP